jgi:hypothetical protein
VFTRLLLCFVCLFFSEIFFGWVVNTDKIARDATMVGKVTAVLLMISGAIELSLGAYWQCMNFLSLFSPTHH